MTYHQDSDLGRMQTSIESKVCPACASPKLTSKVVCAMCFSDLSRPLQNALKFRSGTELADACEQALADLRQIGVRPVEEKP